VNIKQEGKLRMKNKEKTKKGKQDALAARLAVCVF
jgi:hypothetical protein